MNANGGNPTPIGQLVGDMRIKFEYVPLGEVNVLAQQMQDEKGRFAFRKWNPRKIDAPWEEDNSGVDPTHCPAFCICCHLVEKSFKEGFEEVIDRVDLHRGCGSKSMLDEY
jgi:hypothetical protein